MIVLTVLSFNGAPTDALSGRFDELGGTIGRADTNQLVLPDPERSISRVHAQVAFRNGSYVVVDRGSNPVIINGQALGNGRESPLREGDQLQIGGYCLAVSSGVVATARDPFDDLFNARTSTAPTPASAPVPPARTVLPPAPAQPSAWLAATPAPAPTPARAAAGPPASSSASSSAKGPSSSFGIPDDWDPFAPNAAGRGGGGSSSHDDPFASMVPVASGNGSPYIPDLPMSGPSSEDSLDALFGLGAGGAAAGHFGDSPLLTPEVAPNMAADADPLRALSRPAAPVAAPVSDHASELNTPWIGGPAASPKPVAARASEPAPARVPDKPAVRASGNVLSSPPGAVLSWDGPSRETKVVTLPGVRRPAPAPAGTPAGTPAAPPAAHSPVRFEEPMDAPEQTHIVVRPKPKPVPPVAAVPAAASPPPPVHAPAHLPAATVASVATTARPGAVSADNQALLQALHEGLGVSDLRLQSLNPELMRQIGALLRESTRGAVELLVARAALKREVRADVTMIVARENNPLKFSPTVEAALQHLLGPTTPGFMPPTLAMRDAFDDLRAHQLGVMAGMRAALEGVLLRFDPAVLEGKLTRRSTLSNLIPSSRKARLWELFQELYSQLSNEAADDFDKLFGKAFLSAYEAHIDQLQDDFPGR